jgi:arylsulfatase A
MLIHKRITCFLYTVATLCIAHAQQKPNIIFLLADDLGIGDIGCYGQQKIRTPNIDALAKDGMKFTNFYSGSTVCGPCRSSFMTGLHTGHTPVRGNKGIKPEGQYPLTANTNTIARMLQANGYTTADFGKWGLGGIGTDGIPLKQGFDIFYGYNCQTLAHNYYPDHLWSNNDRIELPNKTRDSVYSADLIQQNAMQFINQKHNKPFFLYLSYTLPHAGLNLPRDSVYWNYVKQFNEAPLKQVPDKKQYESGPFEPYPHAAYAAMVARLDKYVGEIKAALKKKGIEQNTLFIFTSDNGPHKEGGNDPEFFNSNGIYRGKKRDLYEGGIHMPFIASWKGKINPNTSSSHIAAIWDMFPTFLDMAGVKNDATIDGISMLPTLLNKGKQSAHEFLYWEFHEEGGKQAVRWGKWKAVQLNVSNEKDGAIELYDLEKDPSEKNNIASINPDIVKKMAAFIAGSHVYNKDWPLLKGEK